MITCFPCKGTGWQLDKKGEKVKCPLCFGKGWRPAVAILLLLLLSGCMSYTDNQIADAIFIAENSTSHPYGIMAHYKQTTPRQACLNTITSSRRTYRYGNFIDHLQKTYCPIGSDNDDGTCKEWSRNVKRLLQRRNNG
jgi:hypothetical protein